MAISKRDAGVIKCLLNAEVGDVITFRRKDSVRYFGEDLLILPVVSKGPYNPYGYRGIEELFPIVSVDFNWTVHPYDSNVISIKKKSK